MLNACCLSEAKKCMKWTLSATLYIVHCGHWHNLHHKMLYLIWHADSGLSIDTSLTGCWSINNAWWLISTAQLSNNICLMINIFTEETESSLVHEDFITTLVPLPWECSALTVKHMTIPLWVVSKLWHIYHIKDLKRYIGQWKTEPSQGRKFWPKPLLWKTNTINGTPNQRLPQPATHKTALKERKSLVREGFLHGHIMRIQKWWS